MNYRHHYHAGNFADVAKHAILLALVDGMQRKDKGFLFLDTHAGRGAYDLESAAHGDSLTRAPEWPEGWGRVEHASDRPALIENYVTAVHAFVRRAPDQAVKPYPGSPLLIADRLREQDRAVFCELHDEEYAALAEAIPGPRNLRVESRDGYEAIRGCLPPLERRALVLIDPPYENARESRDVAAALREGLRRLPAATFAVWYPITERVGVPEFLRDDPTLVLPATWTAELTVAGPDAGLKMSGAGLMVINPPWQLDQRVAPAMSWLGETLAQAPGGAGTLQWLVPE
ncbi:23S rRNA (adenine(2030)-N(6))-methyltransferase RlmJ [Synoicihabitans lomoniglobus]|uniref:Ribosomal RNA large subunit methyltransferase J n=1 Tax=Synoicihabitans lomoniglobus TaxID=2909285 RepID=A0AAE9ZYY6_9BACT|nr:23S rRNA (adenine(2030)-N(6))-methyltransferase RlmJ [Opitutaceae bacterium LMO-M01]WED63007.1 23S rRNA (adenine(2030)-N(6))-methyltransferase RlmJ [Opitutaceae bacterium LMO-M01]